MRSGRQQRDEEGEGLNVERELDRTARKAVIEGLERKESIGTRSIDSNQLERKALIEGLECWNQME
jgi:hypothetical protein